MSSSGFSCHELPARVQAALVERHSTLSGKSPQFVYVLF
jgi:hypothetical protein